MVSGDACNRGQFLGNKPSTRVHAQPGGNSSFSLSWGEPAQKAAGAPAAPMPMEPETLKENECPQDVNVDMSVAAKKGGSGPVSSNAWASNASQNSGNMISERPTTRIHAPPGGKSSIVF